MKKGINIRQHDDTDCAAACLSSICSYYGSELPLVEIREACGTSSQGTSLKGILDASNKLGFQSHALKSSDRELSDLSEIHSPAILHLKRDDGWLHFVVLYRYGDKECLIMDPEEGKTRPVPTQKIESQWSGYVLLLTPGRQFRKEKRRKTAASRYLQLFRSSRKDLVLSLIGAIVYVLSSLSISLFLQQIIDRILPIKDMSLLGIFALAMLLLTLFSLIANYIRSLYTISASIRIDAQLILGYLQKLLELPISFFSNRSSGELNARISDAYRIRSFVSGELIILFISIFSLILSFGLLFTYYWKLALISLGFLPVYLVIYRISERINRKLNREAIRNSAAFQEESIEILNGIRSLRYFGGQDLFCERLRKKYVAMARSHSRGAKNSAFFTALGDGATMLLTFSVLTAGSLYVLEGELSTGEFISFFSIISFFTTPIITLIESNDTISEADIAANRLFEIMDLDSESAQGTLILSQRLSAADITLKNIAFSYPGQMSLFSGLTFTIQNNKLNILKGENGSGKSTIASFLMRSLLPDQGSILLGSTDIQQIPLEQWRNFTTIVPQQVELFNTSILENIRMKKESGDLERVIALCKRCGIWEKIQSLPEGLHSRIGPAGSQLSGGERQKIALVRALYRQPVLLILDEATSALDYKSRNEFRDIFKGLLEEGLTLLLITHDDYFDTLENHMIMI